MPRAEILTIGDELLSGDVTDTNSNYLDNVLSDLGWEVTRHTTVRDEISEIAEAMRETTSRAELVVTSGGLGPTEDDLTLEALARALGCPLRLDQPTLDRIAERFRSFGREMTPNNARQARVPEQGEIIANDAGTAPGFLASLGKAQILLLPGVPREVRWITEHTLQTRFRLPQPVVLRRSLKLVGYGESRLAKDIDPIVTKHSPRIRFGYRAIGTEVHLKLATPLDDSDRTRELATNLLHDCEQDLRSLLGDRIFGTDETRLVDALSERLLRDSATVSVAESCTGGLIAKLLTDRAGASGYFNGGLVTYSNQAKIDLLGVNAATLESEGAVSKAVAAEMATNVRQKFGTTWGLSATGIAGPGGGSDEKPVGTVFVGLAGPTTLEVKPLRVIGDRDMIRSNTALLLLDLLRKSLGA